jgi:hypothetical protein
MVTWKLKNQMNLATIKGKKLGSIRIWKSLWPKIFLGMLFVFVGAFLLVRPQIVMFIHTKIFEMDTALMTFVVTTNSLTGTS